MNLGDAVPPNPARLFGHRQPRHMKLIRRPLSPLVSGLVVAAVLVLHAILAWEATSEKSVTADEILHATAGAYYNRLGDFRLHPENGNLPQRVAALPSTWMHAPLPATQGSRYWATSDVAMIGHEYFYGLGFDHFPLLMAGRALITLFSIGTGLLVFWWTRRLFGLAAGGLAVGLYALDPNILAHAALVTSDTAATFFLLAASGAFWRHLRSPGPGAAALSALTFGLACVAKYSAVLLPPIYLVLVVWHLGLTPRAERYPTLKQSFLSLLGHAASGVMIIWAFYNFRYTAFAPGQPGGAYIYPWEQLLPRLGLVGDLVEYARNWHLLPDAYLYGFAWVVESAKTRAAFLAGEYSITGWTSFFPLSFLWKTPPVLLATLAAGALFVARRWLTQAGQAGRDLTRAAPLVVLFTIYWGFSLTSHLNIGHRHILPIYPVLYILSGGVLAACTIRRLRLPLVAGLLAGQAWTATTIHPDYLAYFNPLAGGPANGWRLLSDSSVDWGQDLPGLAAWLRSHNAPPQEVPLHLSYFGSGEPDYYGIKAARLPFVNGFRQPPGWCELSPGLYAISATMLQQVYSSVRGDWTLAHEKEYQDLRRVEPQLREFYTEPARRRELLSIYSAVQWERAGQRYELLRFARLCAYLRACHPEAVIGHSIFIYRLSKEDLDRSLRRSYSEWLDAIAHAEQARAQ